VGDLPAKAMVNLASSIAGCRYSSHFPALVYKQFIISIVGTYIYVYRAYFYASILPHRS